MWNMDFVFPSLLVLAILVIFFFARPRLPNRLNRCFFFLILSDIATIFADVVSTWADSNYQGLPVWLVSLLNMLFFACYVIRSYLFLHLAETLVWRERTRFSWIRFLALFVFGISMVIVLSSPFTGAVYTVDGAGYHRGPLYMILPISSFIFLALGIFVLLRFRKRLRRGVLISALAYHLILIIGNITRIMFPQYLVMNIFCLMAILVIFLSFENPDLYTTDRGPAFNTRAFTEWLDDPKHRKGARVLGFAIRNYNDQRSMYGGTQMDQGLGMVITWLREEFPHLLLFYLRGGNFCLAGPEQTDWKGIREQILKRFEDAWQAESAELYLNVVYVEMGLSDRTEPSDRIVNTLIYALDEAGDSPDIEQTLVTEEALKEIDRQIEIKRYLDRAIDGDEVEVFLQPIVDSHTRQVVTAEALARIRGEDGKLIPPVQFIPIAEKNGQINQLGEQVFRKVCVFIRKYGLERLGLKWINVNLSPVQCMHSDLSRHFSSELEKCGVCVEQIHLEITEESMVNFSRQGQQIESLLGRGFQLALDDYGSGFSNLHQVRSIAFSNIKLDMSIVWDYLRDRDALLPALVQAFRQLGFSITAEGIETEEAADAMERIGCDYLQGYFFSKPLPAEEFARKYLKSPTGKEPSARENGLPDHPGSADAVRRRRQ